MKRRHRRNSWASCLVPIFVGLLVAIPAACGDSSSSSGSDPCFDQGLADRVDGSISRIQATLVVEPEGTVLIDTTSPAYQSLTGGDRALGRALVTSLNDRVRAGELLVNPDLSVVRLEPAEPSPAPSGTSCGTHWWGEECQVDAPTTKKVLIGLDAGEGALIICDFIPVVDEACAIIEVLGSIPLEAELEPCVDRNDGSILKVTWIGIVYFKCQ